MRAFMEFGKKHFLSIFVVALVFCCGASSDLYASQKIKIGIIQLLNHPDHQVMRESYLKAMKDQGYDVEVMEVFNADSPQYPKAYAQRGADKAKEMVAGWGPADLFHGNVSCHKRCNGRCAHCGCGIFEPGHHGQCKKVRMESSTAPETEQGPI